MIDGLEKEEFRRAVDKRLAHLPKDLVEYYSSVLHKIKGVSESRSELARDIFLWVITAYRPLKVGGLLSALGAQRLQLSLSEDEEPDWPLFQPGLRSRMHAFPLSRFSMTIRYRSYMSR